jgi:hypothetical protein
MANPTIAALRAATRGAPSGPSGPQALNYSWMNTPGQPLVMPVRPPPPPRSPKARRPPDPGLPPPPGSPFIQPQLPGGDGGGYSFIGDWGSDAPQLLVVGPEDPPPRDRPPSRPDRDMGEPGSRYMPEDFFALANLPQAAATPVAAQPLPESVPSAGMDYGLMEFIQPPQFAQLAQEAPPGQSQQPADDFELMEFIQPVPQAEAPVAASAPAVELAPEPVPYMPQIMEPEVPMPAPVRRPKVQQPLEQPEFDQEFLQYLMMSEFGGPGLR